MTRKLIHVAAAVIRDDERGVLIAKRPDDKHQGGLWEFPGGKVESGEPVVDALDRELNEELGIRVEQSRPLIRVPHHYADKSVLLDVYEVERFSGKPWGKEGQLIQWVQPAQLDTFSFPAANGPILNACLLPESLFITPEVDADALLSRVEHAIGKGAQVIMLRAHHLNDDEYRSVAGMLESLCSTSGALLILNRSVELANQLGAEALHLSAERLQRLTARTQFKGRWLSASCHNEAELALAVQKGVDFVTLSPVQTTSSHPQAEAIGWEKFSEWVAECPVPVFALGGLGFADIETVRRNGGQGIAAISAWLEG